MATARNELLDRLTEEFNAAFKNDVGCRRDRHLMDDSWYVINEIVGVMDQRLEEYQQTAYALTIGLSSVSMLWSRLPNVLCWR